MSISYAIAVGLADIHREPASTSERVTQAFLNTPAIATDTHGEWTFVTLPDYQGWIASGALEEPIQRGFTKVGEYCATPLALVAVVTTTHTPLYALPGSADSPASRRGEGLPRPFLSITSFQDSTGGASPRPYGTDEHRAEIDEHEREQFDTVYLSTQLPVLDTTQPLHVQVALPGERTGWLAREAIVIRQQQEAFPISSVRTTTAYARAFLDVPYLWGGMSCRGIDCSGLAQVCYRMAGYQLPRDADQQYAALHEVERSIPRERMREGDLLFFGPAREITHVALALNETEFIHAEGNRFERVLIHSLDRQAANYDARLEQLLLYIKRVVL